MYEATHVRPFCSFLVASREDRTTRPSGFYGFLTDHISRRRTTSQPLRLLSNKLANLYACMRVPPRHLTGVSSIRCATKIPSRLLIRHFVSFRFKINDHSRAKRLDRIVTDLESSKMVQLFRSIVSGCSTFALIS